ncbi:MAG: 2-dehydropantoate 2-reductase, partial [Firmicutes bacterium]|nr:2-dehydropantoate 2-reductase [Bacillota bacterium]
VELFAGTIIEKARKYDIPVPVNKRLYKLIREMEESYL